MAFRGKKKQEKSQKKKNVDGCYFVVVGLLFLPPAHPNVCVVVALLVLRSCCGCELWLSVFVTFRIARDSLM